MKKLDGKVTIITGGAMGIGLGIVKTFLKYGAIVNILDYSEELPSIVDELKTLGEISGYKLDVRDRVAIDEAINDIVSKYGQIDILVNNAGTIRLKPFLETTDEDRDFQFGININGIWNTSHAVVPYMQEGGAIVNLSSVTGPLVADSGEVAYATTKSAIQGFTKGLAAELVGNGIRVNCIQPGFIKTPLVDKLAIENGDDPEQFSQALASGIPMKRLGKIEEAGELVAFLASDEASYITGQAVVIDGGSTMPETSSVGV